MYLEEIDIWIYTGTYMCVYTYTCVCMFITIFTV